MGTFSEPLDAYRQAHRIIWRMGGWRYLSIPVLLSALLAPLMVAGCFWLADSIADWLAGWAGGSLKDSAGWWAEKARALLHPDSWLTTLAAWTFFLLGLLPSYVLFRVVVMLLYGPFLDRLAVKAETLLRSGAEGVAPKVPDGSFLRMAFLNVTVVALSLFLMVAGFAIGLIPVVGFLAGMLVFFPLQMFLASLPLLDPSLERGGFTMLGSVGLAFNHFGRAVFFSTMCFVLMAIPVVGWFLGPTYAVVAGIVLGLRIRERTPPPVKA